MDLLVNDVSFHVAMSLQIVSLMMTPDGSHRRN
jgi:hypothetical protein